MNTHVRSLVLMVLMVTAGVVGSAMRPTNYLADQREKIDLERMVPRQFGDWRELPQSTAQIVNPQQQTVLDQIYSELLSRSYLHASSGRIVMLSIAYGKDQSKQSQVHLPEICYPAQGFQVQAKTRANVQLSMGQIPVSRLIATSGQRTEPVTYWIRIGDQLVRGALEQKIAIVGQGLVGNRTDGILFRVSSIGNASDAEYAAHEKFISALLAAVDSKALPYLIGNATASTRGMRP